MRLLWVLGVSIALLQGVGAELRLTPPYFNIAENRPIVANATCGVGSNNKEHYCRLVGGGFSSLLQPSQSQNIRDGQVCDFCLPPGSDDVSKMHGAENANDGDISTWWQSPPLSRGRKYNYVDLEINLLQSFQVAYVVVTMADSPRPGVWALEKSMDNGTTWTAWQYFASNDGECQRFFNMHANEPITKDDSVICTDAYSKVLPLEGGEIFVALTTGRPSAANIQESEVMLNWLTATNIRLRLMQTKTMLGHLMSVAQGDNTVTRRYYYAIKEISIGGRCVCNGHAYICPESEKEPGILQCDCQHGTTGINCDECLDGFTQKAWRRHTRTDPFECERCNCNGHSQKCHYNETVDALGLSMDIHGDQLGGGVCDDCHSYTAGINCETCIDGYYRPVGVFPNDTTPCVPCDCPDDRHTGNCEAENGQCECKEAYRGADDCSACAQGYFGFPDCQPCPCSIEGTREDANGLPVCVAEGSDGTAELQCPCKLQYGGEFCDQCAEGYYNYPECTPCGCNLMNSEIMTCNIDDGQCSCKAQFGGRTCEECSDGHFNYPNCASCACDAQGSEPEVCSKDTGECICREGYGGDRCDRCATAWWGYPRCERCECSEQGAAVTDTVCDPVDGQCPCHVNYGGRQCSQCNPGYYQYPTCFDCACDRTGSVGRSCSETGVCTCKPGYVGEKCDKCAPDTYNYPLCELCNCNPAGVSDNFWTLGGCESVPEGELCDCKEQVTGRICDSCKPLYWNLASHLPEGCEECNCFRDGTIGRLGICDQLDGQCSCKPAVGGDPDARRCTSCLDGFFGLSANNLLGCTDCDCDLGGSQNRPGQAPTCDVDSGQCECKDGMRGRQCKEVAPNHYIPLLYQLKYEVEDGYRPDGGKVIYDYKQAEFPNFSWRGYAGFSQLQDEVLQDISLEKASTYNTVLRYQNPNLHPLTGTVTIYPVGQPESSEAITSKVLLEPTMLGGGAPAFVTVSGEAGVYPSPFELQPGQWTVSVNIDNGDLISQPVLVDYFTLLPTSYVKPSVLRQEVHVPCRRGVDQEFCRRYNYPPLDRFSTGMGSEALLPGSIEPGKFYDFIGDKEAFNDLGLKDGEVVQLASWQPELNWKIQNSPGPHVTTISYFTEPNKPTEGSKVLVTVKDADGNPLGEGEAYILDCPFSSLCRQVITDSEGRLMEFDLPGIETQVVLKSPEGEGGREDPISIERVVLLPIENWSSDFIFPTSNCVQGKDKECILKENSERFSSPETTVIAIPSRILEQKPSRQMPKGIHDPDTPLVFIDRYSPDHATNHDNKLENPDDYVFMVHYYQPDHPLLYLQVNITNGPTVEEDAVRRGGDQAGVPIGGDVTLQDVQVYEAVLPLPTCTASQGCRSAVVKEAGDKDPGHYRITEEFDIKFMNNGPDGAWIEYVMAMPATDFTPALLQPDDSVNQADRFVQECGQDHFFLPDTLDKEDFCRASVTSISADFNERALQCECDIDGAINHHQCNSFGGQCQCKPHVIGQKCERCEPEYFGFPDCQPCSCPSTAKCDETTGECICAPFVTGTQDAPCTECEENTYGYNAVTGCQECSCRTEGTNGDMSCSLDSGQCNCAERVEGRQCDHCVWGAWNYPDCEACDCDTKGTTEKICDQATSECLCKPNVEPGQCNSCKEGFFNLQEVDPLGCMECFCFGRSSTCSSHPTLVKSQIVAMDGWDHATFTFTGRDATRNSLDISAQEYYGGEIRMDAASLVDIDVDLGSQTYYYQSSAAYGGSQIESYGSSLIWNITYWGSVDPESKKTPDVILKGGDSTLLYFSGKTAAERSTFNMEVPLLPLAGQWLTPSGNAVDRKAFMTVLNRLDNIYIKGSFGSDGSAVTTLGPVALGTGRQVQGAVADEQRAGGVELCDCPAGYTGFSCQLCSPGYFSVREDSGSPICEPCNCNGHAETCHPKTGACEPLTIPIDLLDVLMSQESLSCDDDAVGCSHKIEVGAQTCHECGVYGTAQDYCHFNPEKCEVLPIPNEGVDNGHCRDNTRGRNCELCDPGYFGDATRGGEDDCKSCPCPLEDNNFAESCDALLDNDLPPEERVCNCLPHYTGERCEQCGPGYFGQPEIVGGDCQPCNCNGNIDVDDPMACDSTSGLCLLCQGNSTGDNCERCQDWFYGDAINAKNCEKCTCDPQGTERCDHFTGQCICKPGVEGVNCDRCQADQWGFASGTGCFHCNCTDASEHGQCDQATGQCVCKGGVRGQKCEYCETGFWNLGVYGCEPCACNADYAVGGGCIQETGQCTCLPYVEGINCDGCPENSILIQNEWRSGPELPAWKEPFDHVDGCFPCESCIEDLMSSMKKIRSDLDPIMEDFKSKEASFYAHTRLNYLNTKVDGLIPEIKLLNPVEGNSRIQPLEEATARITGLSKSLNLEYKLERLKEWAEMAQVLETDGSNAVNDMGLVGVEVNRVIQDVESIVGVLAQGMNAALHETSLRNAERHLEEMQQLDFTETRRQAEEEQNEARIMMERVNEMSRPVEEFKEKLKSTEQRMADLGEKITDIRGRTKMAEELYLEADWINRKNKNSPASRNIQKIKDKTEATKASQDLSESLVEEAEGFLQEAKESYSDLGAKRVPMDFQSVNLENNVQTYKDEVDNLLLLERDAGEKAHELTMTAKEIEDISTQAQAPAQAAINAATVFKNIITLVTDAKTAAEAAAADSEKAAGMSNGVANKASKELARINTVYSGGAMDAGAAVKVELGPKLATSKRQVERLTQQTTDIKQDLESINSQLGGMDDLAETIDETKKLAGDSLKDGEDALASIKARASDISLKKTVAHEVRNNNTEFNVAKTNIKKALNEYESKPNRDKRETTGNDITDRLDRLNKQKTLIESLANRNSDLVVNIKDHIEEARRLLGRMNKPAVTFSTGSNLELNNPDNLEDLATKTDISFYVKGVGATNDTTEANDRAFMFYLGNLEGTSKKLPKVVSDDFMAIEVMKSAFVQLTMDLGSGPVTITSTKPLRANDWSQVMVKREGRNVELIVRTENGPGEIESDSVKTSFPLMDPEGQPYLSGSVFNLHQEYSKIYVGGFPTGSGVQNSVRSTDMTGQIEGLKIGGKEVGLWNYKSASLIEPSVETRNKFIPRKTSELRFNGDGYMKLKPEDYSLENEQDNIVEFEFRTTHPEGLMFLTGSPDQGYLAIQLRDSRIVFSFKLGSAGEIVEIQSEPVELETWVHVRAERSGHSGTLIVDKNPDPETVVANQDSAFELSGISDLYFGSYPLTDYPELQQGGFFGCIKNAKIHPDSIDHSVISSDQVELVNVDLECEPPRPPIQGTVSFNEATPGFVRLPPIQTNGSLSLSFMFRTTATHGLITYLREPLMGYYISLSMLDGALHLYAHPDIQIVTRNPENQEPLQFNDNQWHVASITVLQEPTKMIFLQIDDFFEYKSGEVANLPLLTDTTYEAFFGGIPDDVDLMSGVTAHKGSYIGCIRDLVLLEEYVDWEAEATITGATLSDCDVQEVVQMTTTEAPWVDILPPPPEATPEYDPRKIFPDVQFGQMGVDNQGSCRLPVSPALDPDLNINSGLRFGTKAGSYIEYVKKNLPDMMVDQNRFYLEFKTSSPEGLIFMMVHEEGKTDFIALFVKGGRLVYSFNCGSGASHLATNIRVDDGKWHTVEFSRVAKQGKLVFDSIEVKVQPHNRESQGSTTNLEVRPNIFLGGVEPSIAGSDDLKRDLQIRGNGNIKGFIGCLRKVKYEVSRNGRTRMKSLGTKWEKNNKVIPCSEKVEPGYFFGRGGGRIRAEKRFRVGLDFDITMMIKPRNLTGILAAVRGRRDYLVLAMNEGAIEFTVDNGRGPIQATFQPGDKHEFCNGEWHEIHAVKAKNVVTLSVNKIFAQPGIGVPGVSSTDTNNPLFLGGHPRPGKFSIRGDQVNYSGCMKEVVIEGKPVEMTADRLIGDIHSHVCPTI